MRFKFATYFVCLFLITFFLACTSHQEKSCQIIEKKDSSVFVKLIDSSNWNSDPAQKELQKNKNEISKEKKKKQKVKFFTTDTSKEPKAGKLKIFVGKDP